LINQQEYILKKVDLMVKLEISLFNPDQILLNSSPVAQFELVKVRTNMAYLAAEAFHTQPHESLTVLL
jgi:hypothetical protein